MQAELDAYIAAFADERDENGRRLVMRRPSSLSKVPSPPAPRETLL
ncbi:hypothetical protein [Nonomuraea sp. CA-141351]